MIHDINKSDKYFYFHINQDVSVTGYAGNNIICTVVYMKGLLFWIPNQFENMVFYESLVPFKCSYSQQQPFPNLTKSLVSVNTSPL